MTQKNEEEVTTAADVFVRCLAKCGVKEIYGVPGEANPDFMFALMKYQAIPFFTVRHEQGGAFMAYGTSVANLRNGINVPGVCLSTEGPGATNLMTGLACAQVDRVPLIAITGQAAQDKSFKRGFQVIDVVEMTKPITKWSVSIKNPTSIPQVVANAFQLALTPPYGVVHIEFPLDVARQPVDPKLVPLEIPIVAHFPFPDPKAIDIAYEKISNSQNPIFLVGPDLYVRLTGDNIAWKVFRQLVEKSNIGVVVAPGGKGALPVNDDRFLYALNFPPDDLPTIALQAASLIVSVGYDVAEYASEFWNVKPVDIVRIIVFKQLNINHFPAFGAPSYNTKGVEVVGDIGTTLAGLLQRWNKPRAIPTFYSDLRAAFKATLTYGEKPSQGCENPAVFQGMIVNKAIDFMKKFGDDAIVVLDSGFHQIWTLRNGDMDHPFNLISSNSMASMGVGLPAALGVARTSAVNGQKKKILLMTGDGGFLMNVQEMATLKKFTNLNSDVQIVVLVWNDSALGFVQWAETDYKQKHADVSFFNPDFEQLGNCFPGWRGLPQVMSDPQNITNALTEAFREDKKESVLFSVFVSPEQNNYFVEYLKKQMEDFKHQHKEQANGHIGVSAPKNFSVYNVSRFA